MHGVEDFEKIRRAYFIDGMGLRRISREMRVHRRTVKAAIANAEPAKYERLKVAGPTLIGPHAAWIDEVLKADRQAPRKQRHTARRIFRRLRTERSFEGSEPTVRAYVARRKRELGFDAPQVFVPLDHPPGRDGQVDWGMAIVKIGGEVCTAHLLEVRACHSGAAYVEAFPIERQEALFEGLKNAFEYFGGVFHVLAADNMRVAVKRILRGRSRLEQDGFIAFRSHYLFKAHFCLPGEGGAHEKGGVEGQVGFTRRNWLVPVPDFPTWSALNEFLRAQCRIDLSRTIEKRPKTIGAMLEEEKALFLPLPAHAFECARALFVRADTHARVRVDGVRYSVPMLYARRELAVKLTPWEVRVVHDGTVIAHHARRYQPGMEVLDPVHYIPALETKPHLLDHGRPFVNWRLPKIFEEMRGRLERKGPGGLKEYIRVLKAIAQCDIYTVGAAIQEALNAQSVSADTVLERLAARGIATQPAFFAREGLGIQKTDLGKYDQLLKPSTKEIDHGAPAAPQGIPEAAAPASDGPGV